MKDFAKLIKTLDSTNRTTVKVAALSAYFDAANERDKVWTIAILSHRRPPRPVNTTLLRTWAAELAGIPLWLFEDSYHIVGDLAETIALVVPNATAGTDRGLSEFMTDLIDLKKKTEAEKKAYLLEYWGKLDYYGRFVLNKLITGGFRIGVSQKLMTRALSQSTQIDEDILAYKLMGNWDPMKISFKELVLERHESDYLSKPYPFYLAYALEAEPEELGAVSNWSFEHKWDGIRCQTIVRNDTLFVWSRGEELVTDKYPEFQAFVGAIPNGTVLDGELLPFPNQSIGSFNDLQTRIGRKTVSKALLQKVPVILKVYDLLEWKGEDIRHKPFQERRALLDGLLKDLGGPEGLDKEGRPLPLYRSDTMQFKSWEEVALERERSREVRSEGLMLKRKDSPYLVGRKKGDWWKWKVDPLTIDAVLTYAMRGHGRRSNLFTDYTFALWTESENGERELVTFAKAYSGLSDAEFKKVDAWIKKIPWNALGPYAPLPHITYSKSPLRVLRLPKGIKVGWLPVFRVLSGGDRTKTSMRPIP